MGKCDPATSRAGSFVAVYLQTGGLFSCVVLLLERRYTESKDKESSLSIESTTACKALSILIFLGRRKLWTSQDISVLRRSKDLRAPGRRNLAAIDIPVGILGAD